MKREAEKWWREKNIERMGMKKWEMDGKNEWS